MEALVVKECTRKKERLKQTKNHFNEKDIYPAANRIFYGQNNGL